MTAGTTRLRLLVLGLNYAPELVGIGVYTTGMAETLAGMGHDVRVVAGQPYYPQWRTPADYSAWRWTRSRENGVEVLRCPHYVPRRPSGARRILHHVSFAMAALLPALFMAITHRPQVVVAIAPSILASPVARLAALIVGAKCWLHVQDLEVEAALATGLLHPGLGSKLALLFQRGVFRAFDRVSSISPKMCEHLRSRGVDTEKVVEFRNWVETGTVSQLDRDSAYRDEWGISTPHVALYSGNIANKQGLDVVVEAARLLSQREDITFVICGEGSGKLALEQSAVGIPRLQFRNLQPKERLSELLGLATVHLLPQLASAADLVLPSKLGNMLASGRVVIATAAPGSGLAAEVAGCGYVVEPENAKALAAAIERVVDSPEDYNRLARQSRARAEDRFSGPSILGGFAAELVALSATHQHRQRVRQ